jgi:hypothetical protein
MWSKVHCTECEHYAQCPLKTRLFINYCGSRKNMVERDVNAAFEDCRSRRTYIVKQRLRSNLAAVPHPASIRV